MTQIYFLPGLFPKNFVWLSARFVIPAVALIFVYHLSLQAPKSLDFDQYLRNISLDCVIFGFHENELKVLLLKLKKLELWALPGGFIPADQDIDAAATQVLLKRTGLSAIFLQQFHTFGKLDRNQLGHGARLVKHEIIPGELEDWFNQRFISIGYYALVEYSKVQEPTPDLTSERCEWIPLAELPPLMLDHKQIIARAHQTLKKELQYQPIGLNLLPDEFTMPELQALYETILQTELDRRNFRRKMLSYDILVDTQKRRMGSSHKAPILYRFDEVKYQVALESGWKPRF